MGKFIDLTGQRFGRLTVKCLDVERNESDKLLGKNRTHWICECECGNTISVSSGNLRGEITKSCGCLQKQRAREGRTIDLTNCVFGRLTVIKLDTNKIEDFEGNYWICKCECGEKISVCAGNLKNGHTKSCGCLKHERSKTFKDLTEMQFGKLKVLYLDEDRMNEEKISNKKHKNTYWICKCDCGNTKSIYSKTLLDGRITSCGCDLSEKLREINFEDLTGLKFGRLQVVSYDNEKSEKFNISMWKCECECGEKKSVRASKLKNGETVSCGCYRKEKLTGENHYNWKGGKTDLKRYLRETLKPWKKESLENADYKCCITGKRGKFNVHHIYPFQYIFDETMLELKLPIHNTHGEYTRNELDLIIKTLNEKHFKYGFGAVILEDIHIEFHKIYGCGNYNEIPPSIKEWEEFKNNYIIKE